MAGHCRRARCGQLESQTRNSEVGAHRMARKTTETTLRRYEREGRGEGHRGDYVPQIKVGRGEFSSRGRSSVENNLDIGGRQHHLLSKLESAIRLFLSWLWQVVDIREQFPLGTRPHENPLNELLIEHEEGRPSSSGTLALATQLGIQHPWHIDVDEAKALTTDLVVTLRSGAYLTPTLAAISCKYESELNAEDERVERRYDLLDLEQAYWSEVQHPWWLVTDRHYHYVPHQNLIWASEAALVPPQERPLEALVSEWLRLGASVDAWDGSLYACLDNLGRLLGVSTPESIAVFKHAVWYQLIEVDLTTELWHLMRPSPTVRVGRPRIPSWHFMSRAGQL